MTNAYSLVINRMITACLCEAMERVAAETYEAIEAEAAAQQDRRRELFRRRYEVTKLLVQQYRLLKRVSAKIDADGMVPDIREAWSILDELAASEPPIKAKELASFLRTKTRVFQLTSYIDRQLDTYRDLCANSCHENEQDNYRVFINHYVMGYTPRAIANQEKLSVRGLNDRNTEGLMQFAHILFEDTLDYTFAFGAGQQ